MDVPDKKGNTVRDHLLFVYKKTGKKPSLLKEEPKSSHLEQNFLKLFWKVQNSKQSQDRFLTPKDILAWCELYQQSFCPLEAEYLIMLDNILVVELSKSRHEQ